MALAISVAFGSASCGGSEKANQGEAPTARASRLPWPGRSLLETRDWLNTPGLREEDLRGKVVLVNFWTYSCINSLRALPYVQAWADRYRDQGLVVVGVHTPEFAFETDLGNVRRATAALRIHYPVALDSDRATWTAFHNRAWPAFYVIGADGRLRLQALGEGGYARLERSLQQLLSEANGKAVADGVTEVVGVGPQAAADERDLASPETYVGHAHAARFASPGGVRPDVTHAYSRVAALPLNRWSLDGTWTVGREFATQNSRSGRIAYRFHARDLHLVLAPSVPGHPIRYRVRIDGADPGPDHGGDVDAEGRGVVREPRMYQMVRQSRPVADRTFEVEFLDPGVRAYVFTFG